VFLQARRKLVGPHGSNALGPARRSHRARDCGRWVVLIRMERLRQWASPTRLADRNFERRFAPPPLRQLLTLQPSTPPTPRTGFCAFQGSTGGLLKIATSSYCASGLWNVGGLNGGFQARHARALLFTAIRINTCAGALRHHSKPAIQTPFLPTSR